MVRTLFPIILFLILALLEWYVFKGLKAAFPVGRSRRVAMILDLVSVIISFSAVITVFIAFKSGYSQANLFTNIMMGLFVTLFVTKLVFAAFLIGEDLYRSLRWGFMKGKGIFEGNSGGVEMVSRRKFVGQLGLLVAAIPFTSLLYGLLKGKYDFRVEKVKLPFEDLPQEFDGLKIIQISDIHSGSFDSKEAVRKGVEMIQAQNPDIILFTGDLVNNLAEEIEPYMDIFGALHAPMGKFSVLGNHDYGSYVEWQSPGEKTANLEKLIRLQREMGFQVLNNESIRLEKNGDNLLLAGVENWGRPPFPQKGDLNKAFGNASPEEFTILMSHDPTHWDLEVLKHSKHVHLTLSGHTHGGQMGVEIPGFRMSVAQLAYKRWAGLYRHKGQYLYVNRGFGFLGYPGRAGIWPEITEITLVKAKA